MAVSRSVLSASARPRGRWRVPAAPRLEPCTGSSARPVARAAGQWPVFAFDPAPPSCRCLRPLGVSTGRAAAPPQLAGQLPLAVQGVGARSPVRDSHAAVGDPLCSPAWCFTWILGHIHHRDWILSFVHVCGRSENWGARRHEVGVSEREPLRPHPGAAGCSGLGVQA